MPCALPTATSEGGERTDDDADSDSENDEEEVWEPKLEYWDLEGVRYLVDRESLDVFDDEGAVLCKWGEGPTSGAEIPPGEQG